MMWILGGLLYRWRGHKSNYKKYFPRPFNQIVFALPYGYVTYGYYDHIWPAFVVLAVTTLGVLTGHGRGMSLADPKLIGEPETTEFLIKWLENKIPVYWYKAAILAATGLAITLPSGILTLNPALALSGILKAPAYMLGNWLFNVLPKEAKTFIEDGKIVPYMGISGPPHHFDTAPELGEFLTGCALWGSIVPLAHWMYTA